MLVVLVVRLVFGRLEQFRGECCVRGFLRFAAAAIVKFAGVVLGCHMVVDLLELGLFGFQLAVELGALLDAATENGLHDDAVVEELLLEVLHREVEVLAPLRADLDGVFASRLLVDDLVAAKYLPLLQDGKNDLLCLVAPNLVHDAQLCVAHVLHRALRVQ